MHHFLKFVLRTTTSILRFCMSLVAVAPAKCLLIINNNIPTFECLIRRDIFSFTSRLKVSTNLLINTIDNCWLLKHVIWKLLHVDKLFL